MLGHIVDGIGDFDGDGYDDIAIGAHAYVTENGDGGTVFVFRGSPNGIVGTNPDTAFARLEPGQADTRLGIYAAGAGDVDDDGFGDVIAGADFFDAGQVDEGVAFVYLGVPEPRLGLALTAGVALLFWLSRVRISLRSRVPVWLHPSQPGPTTGPPPPTIARCMILRSP